MANQIIIDIGAAANDGTGDPLRTAFNYVNDNFSNIWATGVANSNIGFSGNKILTINTNGNLVLAPNGIGKVVSNVDIRPNANNTLSLGSSALRWNSVYTQNLDVGGNVSFADITVDGNLTVTGNIIEMGNIVTDAKTIQLANTAANASSANGSGITVGASDNIATLLYNSTSNIWTTNIGISATGNVSGTYFIGNGSQLTGLPATYGNSNVATLLSSFGSNSISTTGNISAGYFVGNGALLTGISIPSLGNLSVTGSAIQLATGAPNTSVYLTANGVSGNAYVRVPSNPTTLSDGLSIVNLYGRVEIKAKDGAATQSWYFQEDGSLQLPGSVPAHITSDNDVVIQTGSGDHWTFDNTGLLTAPGNISATNFVGNGAALTNVATLGTGSWTVATGTNSYSFTVDPNESYTMWVNGNIPNGIVVWNATVTLTNNNVPAIGSQYGWFYEAGNALVLNSIPDQIIGTVGSISNASSSVANTNVFTFSITNNSGNSQTVNYGWTRIS